ncbi:hypothetical protein ACVWXL_004514 [Bradyrhizobium sp. GM22.5]
MSSGRSRRLGGRRRHGLGRVQRDRVGRGALARRRAVEQAPGPQSGRLGFQIDQGTIQGIAGRPGRHGGLQGLTGETAGHGVLHGLDGGKGRLRRLAIAGIGHAFAAAGQALPADLGHNGDGLGLGAPADGETACDGKALDSRGEGRNFAGSHFELWRNLNLLVTSSN